MKKLFYFIDDFLDWAVNTFCDWLEGRDDMSEEEDMSDEEDSRRAIAWSKPPER